MSRYGSLARRSYCRAVRGGSPSRTPPTKPPPSFRDLCTLGELHDLASAWAVVRLLTRAPTPTVVASAGASRPRSPASPQWLRLAKAVICAPFERWLHGIAFRISQGGCPMCATAPGHPQQGRSRGAFRRVELLRDAGLVFEAGERGSWWRGSRISELDILFVRTNDIVEFVCDGSPNLASPGSTWWPNPVSTVQQVRKLGFGRCRLTLPFRTDSPYNAPRKIWRLRVPSHMNLTNAISRPGRCRWTFIRSRALPSRPELGLAEAIVDLVSTGSLWSSTASGPSRKCSNPEAVLLANAGALQQDGAVWRRC